MAISVGSVSVDVVPSTRGFATDLKAKLKGVVAEIGVRADTALLRAELDEVTRDRRATIEVNADTAVAESQIDFAARDRSASVRANVSGLSEATRGISGLAVAAATLGPALIPIVAAVGGLALALAGPVALAGGGLTIGALIAGKAISDTKKQQKDIADLAKKVQAAQLAVQTASTPAGKRSAMVREAAAVDAYRNALAQLTPAQKKFIDAQDRLKQSFQKLTTSAGGAVFGPVVKGMGLLAKILPKLKPLIVGVASGVNTLLDDLGTAVSKPGFRAFARAFGKASGDAIVAFGRIFGNVTKGLVSFFRAFGPLSKAFVGGLGSASAAFAGWAANLSRSKSFRSFLGYLKDVGPKVASALGHMFQALGKIAAVMAPLGGLVLGFVDGISKLIIAASPTQLAAIATAIGAIGVAVLFATGGLSGIIPAILGLGIGFSSAYTHSTKFRDVVDKIGGFFSDRLLPALKDAWHTVLPGLQKGFDNVRDSVQKNEGLFRILGDVAKLLGKALVDVVIPAVAKFYSVYLPILGKAIGVAITGVRLFGDAFLAMAQFGLTGFRFLVSAALSAFGAILSAASTGLGWIPGIGGKIKDAKKAFDQFSDNTVAALGATITQIQKIRDELDGIKPKTVEVRVKFKTDQLVLNPSLAKPRGIDGAGATGAIVNRPTVALIGEDGPEALIPLNQTPGNSPLPGGRSGAQFEFSGPIYAQDVNDFLRQIQDRARHSSLDGVRR